MCVCVCARAGDSDFQGLCDDVKNYGIATSAESKEEGWLQVQVRGGVVDEHCKLTSTV